MMIREIGHPVPICMYVLVKVAGQTSMSRLASESVKIQKLVLDSLNTNNNCLLIMMALSDHEDHWISFNSVTFSTDGSWL